MTDLEQLVLDGRCGAWTPTGPCRRRVVQAWDRCHLHPPFHVARSDGTVHVNLNTVARLSFGERTTTIVLLERDALELAREIQRACTQLDTEGDPPA
ncbi:MAG: hypothetical protein Q4F65_11235 [Propionibacteriaceae bacterium]|nr:hypothetical protein [Propionibacteriaceae bacterium]